jgi:hypothetical protein
MTVLPVLNAVLQRSGVHEAIMSKDPLNMTDIHIAHAEMKRLFLHAPARYKCRT